MCSTCTESLIVSYTFWQQVKQSDEKYESFSHPAATKTSDSTSDEADKTYETSDYGIINIIEYIASDNDQSQLTDDDSSMQYICNVPKRKQPRTCTKVSPDEKPVGKIANIQNMALPHFTISNNSHSENEDNDPLLTLDDLIEDLSPPRKFKTMNVSAIKLDANDVENSAAELRNLEKMVQDDGKSIFKCKHCPKAFATAYHLMIHTRKSHVCQHCLEAFEKPTDLYAHIKEKHDKFDCLLCGRVFRSNSNLRQHMRKMHSVFLPAHVSLLNIEQK